MQTVLGSFFTEDDLTALKYAVLYSDEVLLVSESTALMAPVEKLSRKRFIGRADARWDLAPEEIQRAASTAIAEGIVRLVKSPTSERKWPPFLDAFNDVVREFFDIDANGLGSTSCNEILNLCTGHAAVVRFMNMKSDYYPGSGMLATLYSFATGVWFTEALVRQAPLLTDSPVVSRMLVAFMSNDTLATRYNVAAHRLSCLAEQVLRL
jgi:hypothetical protein